MQADVMWFVDVPAVLQHNDKGFVTGLTETKKMTTLLFNLFGLFATKFENNERKAIVKL